MKKDFLKLKLLNSIYNYKDVIKPEKIHLLLGDYVYIHNNMLKINI